MVFAPIPLPTSFPLTATNLFSQSDAPITFLHSHDCLELGFCYEGAGVFVVGEKVLPFQAGAVSFIGPAEFHLARSMAGTRSEWIWLYLDPVRLLAPSQADFDLADGAALSGRAFRNIITPAIDPVAGTLVGQMIEELRMKRRGYQAACRGLTWTLMARVHRLTPRSKRKVAPAANRALHRIAPALDLMTARYADRLTLRVLAGSCHASTSHFRRLFQRALKQSPHQYLTQLRVRMAASRLQATEAKIVVVAEDVGFATLSSFNRAFRKLMKMTPRVWRERGGG